MKEPPNFPLYIEQIPPVVERNQRSLKFSVDDSLNAIQRFRDRFIQKLDPGEHPFRAHGPPVCTSNFLHEPNRNTPLLLLCNHHVVGGLLSTHERQPEIQDIPTQSKIAVREGFFCRSERFDRLTPGDDRLPYATAEIIAPIETGIGGDLGKQ